MWIYFIIANNVINKKFKKPNLVSTLCMNGHYENNKQTTININAKISSTPKTFTKNVKVLGITKIFLCLKQ